MANTAQHEYRTHTCGQLRAENVGETVRLSGWVAVRRDHGGLLFIDLRDHYGVTQLVAGEGSDVAKRLASVPRESVIRIDGKVGHRPEGTVNDKLPTGAVEVAVSDVAVLGQADTPPFLITGDDNVGEDTRLRYRFLDLRRDRLHRNIVTRSKIIASLRKRMEGEGFTEFQTPILTSSSPEGARDYLVPSRRHPGKFYALPQAPQQFKQLLMLSGFDRYFQIAPCFRDEDARADRSPGEFYQLDVEMSFATQEDVFEVIERVMAGLFNEFRTTQDEVKFPFVRIPYAEAMAKYGTDKPDLRIKTEIVDLTDTFASSDFRAFAGKTARALLLPKAGEQSRSYFDNLTKSAVEMGAGGMAWLTVQPDSSLKGPIAKFLSEDVQKVIRERTKATVGDAIVFVADDKPELPSKVLGRVRVQTGEVTEDTFAFCWITDFPMYELGDDGKTIDFSHNPFSMPQGGLDALNSQDPLKINAFQYDIVCNGYELSSGAVRNHNPDTMYRAFEIAGYAKEEVESRFPALLNAFKFGAPPHAGIAPGIDRIVMLLTGEETIREVIAFPMNQQAQDLMMNAPSEVRPQQLVDVHIMPVLPKG